MKIAFVVNEFPCLSQTFILNQITGLIDRGHGVDIYATKSDVTSKIHMDVEKYNLLDKVFYFPEVPKNKFYRLIKGFILLTRHYRQPKFLLNLIFQRRGYGIQLLSLRWIYSTVPFLCRQKYDIVHCHFGMNGLKGMIFQDIGNFSPKLITTFHGYDVNRETYTDQNIYKPLCYEGDLYTVNTTFTKNKAVKLGFPEKRIIKLPVGLDLSKYRFQEKKLLPGDTTRIVTVARLVEKKGLEYSIQSVAKVIKSYPNIQYQIIGDGELRSELESLIASLNLKDKIKLCGWMNENEVRQQYEDAHIFILSSVTASNGDMEGQGLVLQEAQAMGLPVLSTLHNGIPDGVLDGKSGFLVPEKDVDALAEKLQYLVEHPETWAEMGKAGRDYVEQHYDIEKLNNRLVDIYQKLLES